MNEWGEPWWINPRVPPASGPRGRRAAREFSAMAGQICLVAWMLGLLAESACASRWPPELAAAWGDAVQAWTPPATAAAAPVDHGEISAP